MLEAIDLIKKIIIYYDLDMLRPYKLLVENYSFKNCKTIYIVPIKASLAFVSSETFYCYSYQFVSLYYFFYIFILYYFYYFILFNT